MYKIKYYIIYYTCFLFLAYSSILFTQDSNANNFANLPNSRRLANNIDAKFRSTNSLIIEWRGIYNPSLVYYVYRSTTPILSKPLLSSSTVVGNVQSVNNTEFYSIVDSPPTYGKYYYAIVSYIDNIGFYTGIPSVDTLALDFTESRVIKQGEANSPPNYYNDVVNSIISNTNDIPQQPPIVEEEELPPLITNDVIPNTNNIIPPSTNGLGGLEDSFNFNSTQYVFVVPNSSGETNTNKATTDNTNKKPAISDIQKEYNRYLNEYNKAVAQFRVANYKGVITILEPISRRNINKDLYYKINLLLGKSYKATKQKKYAINTFKRIQSINPKEVNFWINQVLSDL